MKLDETNKNNILYLDDERINLDTFVACFSDVFNVYIADNVNEAGEILMKNEIKIVITDQRMPDLTGIEFIQKFQSVNSNTVFIILSAFPENDYLLSSINKIALFRFMIKPWNEFDMLHTLQTAIQIYNSKVEKQKLIYDLQIAQEKAFESDRLKSAFLANLTHEIRTPLNGILGFTKLLKRKILCPEKLKEYQSVIEDSCNRLTNIIEEIITISRLQTGNIKDNFSEFYLKHFLNSIKYKYYSLANNKNIKLVIDWSIQVDDLYVKADKTKLHEIFNQLLGNAVKFTEQGSIHIGLHKKEEFIFYIKDTGIGISKNKLKIIFESFRQESEEYLTREYGGIGLGLTIAKGLIEMAGGKIWIESEKGKGSTCWFTYPIKVLSKSYNSHDLHQNLTKTKSKL